jgi:hypothetical protein
MFCNFLAAKDAKDREGKKEKNFQHLKTSRNFASLAAKKILLLLDFG